jgi:purine-binding chemotaxis protein CheW
VTGSHLLVGVGAERYALAVRDVIEVATLEDLTTVPGAPRAVMGVHNLRGQVVPVVDLGAVLGLPGTNGRRAIVIVDDAGDPAGLAVDSLLDVCPVEAEAKQPEDGRLLGSAMVDGALVGILDVRDALRLARGAA